MFGMYANAFVVATHCTTFWDWQHWVYIYFFIIEVFGIELGYSLTHILHFGFCSVLELLTKDVFVYVGVF